MRNNIVRQRKEGEPTIVKNGNPEILYKGFIGAMVKLPVLLDKGHGYIEKDFQKFVRTPGVRLIALQNKKILFTKEFRHELGRFDYRLPGGKVFDNLDDFLPYILDEKEVQDDFVLGAARAELQEEASKSAGTLRIFKKSHSGASVGWDLYYVVAEDISDFHEETENEGEQIEEVVWRTFGEVKEMCLSGEISEDRTVATLLQFIEK